MEEKVKRLYRWNIFIGLIIIASAFIFHKFINLPKILLIPIVIICTSHYSVKQITKSDETRKDRALIGSKIILKSLLCFGLLFVIAYPICLVNEVIWQIDIVGIIAEKIALVSTIIIVLYMFIELKKNRIFF